MIVTREQVVGLNALLDVVARYGVTTATGDEHVTIVLGATAYRFLIHRGAEQASQQPFVLLASITAMTADAAPEPVLYAQSGLLFLVEEATASRITAAFDRFGQCVWCAGYGHGECAALLGEQCSCACRAEWAAVSAVRMAMQVMMQAPLRQQAPYGDPRLGACQAGSSCEGCGHAGCAARRASS